MTPPHAPLLVAGMWGRLRAKLAPDPSLVKDAKEREVQRVYAKCLHLLQTVDEESGVRVVLGLTALALAGQSKEYRRKTLAFLNEQASHLRFKNQAEQ